MTTPPSASPTVDVLLENFTSAVPGVRHALVVSSDGLLIAVSIGLDRTTADLLAATVSGLASLSHGAARRLAMGELQQAILEMADGFMFLMSVGEGTTIAVIADISCDVGQVGYELAVLAGRTAELLTPHSILELRRSLPHAVTGS